MKQEQFDKLPQQAQQAEIDHYNNTERVWYSFWPKCHHRVSGTMPQLTALISCPTCGHNGR